MEEKYLAMLNSVYEDGSVAEVIAASLVKTPEDGECWFCDTKPNDGTHVDYALYKLSNIRTK